MRRGGIPVLALGLLLPALVSAQDAEQQKVLDKVRCSVVALRNEEGYGSGFILDEQGTILTNAHVIVSPVPLRVEAEVRVKDSVRSVVFNKVTLLGVHPTRDLALIRIDPAEQQVQLTPLPIAKTEVVTGNPIHAIGFPSTSGGGIKCISSGDVTGVNQFVDAPGYFEITAKVSHGSSGGPVVDGFGHAVGVVTRGLVRGGQIAWAIPMNDFRPDLFVPLDQRGRNPAKASACLRLAERLLKEAEGGNPWGAIFAFDFYQMAVVEDIGNADTYFKIGLIYRAARKHALAIAYLTRSLQLQPWSETRQEGYYELGVALSSANKKAEAEIVLNEGLAKYPTDAGLLWDAIAVHHYDAGRYFEAACASRASLRAFGPRADVMNELYDRARKRMDVETQIRLRNWEGQQDATLAKQKNDAEQAQRDGKKWMTPAFESFLANLKNVQKEAVNFNFDTLGKGPNPPKVTAIPDAELIPIFITSRITVASEHMKAGRFEQAQEILEDVIKTYPDRPETETARVYLAVLKKR